VFFNDRFLPESLVDSFGGLASDALAPDGETEALFAGADRVHGLDAGIDQGSTDPGFGELQFFWHPNNHLKKLMMA